MTTEYTTRRFIGADKKKYRATYDPDSLLPKGWAIFRGGSAVNWRKTEAEMLQYFREIGAKEITAS